MPIRSIVEVERADVDVDAGRRARGSCRRRPSGRRPIATRPFWIRNGPKWVTLAGSSPRARPRSCWTATAAERVRDRPRGAAPDRRRRGRRRPTWTTTSAAALEAQAVAVVDEREVEAGLQLLAERGDEAVGVGERERDVDALEPRAAPTRSPRARPRSWIVVDVEVRAVVLAELEAPSRRRGRRRRSAADEDARPRSPTAPRDDDVRRGRRLDRGGEPASRVSDPAADGEEQLERRAVGVGRVGGDVDPGQADVLVGAAAAGAGFDTSIVKRRAGDRVGRRASSSRGRARSRTRPAPARAARRRRCASTADRRADADPVAGHLELVRDVGHVRGRARLAAEQVDRAQHVEASTSSLDDEAGRRRRSPAR